MDIFWDHTLQSPLHGSVHYKVNMYCTCLKKHKPLGPIAECPFWSLSASVEPEEDSEAVSFNMAACFIKVDRMS